jgi:hypothetical protein
MAYRRYPAALVLALCLAPALPAQEAPSVEWKLSAHGKALALEIGEMGATCEALSLPVIACNAPSVVQVTAADNRVNLRLSEIRSEGPAVRFEASAERVTRTKRHGTAFTLEGNAKLLLVVGDRQARVSTDRITVDLATGRIESDLNAHSPQPSAPPPPTPSVSLPPIAAPPPPPPTTSPKDREQIFNFFMGSMCR